MIELSRRHFFVGLGALLATPAIVHAKNIMPVRLINLETYGPGGFLSMEMITREMARLMSIRNGFQPMVDGTRQAYVNAFERPHRGALDHQQAGTDMFIRTVDRNLSLETFSERILVPAANMLSEKIGPVRLSSSPPESPGGVYECSQSCGVRGLTAYSVTTDQMITRFDVLY